MAKYQKAKPFDIVDTIKTMQAQIKAMQVQSPGQTTSWIDVSGQVSSTFSVPANGFIKYRKTIENCIQISFSVQQIVAASTNPGSLISSTVPYVPASAVTAASITATSAGGHWVDIVCDAQTSNGGVNFNAMGASLTVTSEGFIYMRGIGSGAHYVSGDVRIPLDV
jgi:hypothetical protein